VTSLATGGLQSPRCLGGTNGSTCNIGEWRGFVFGFYLMVGVPIYAATLSQFAGFFSLYYFFIILFF
jgi:hypothetical protein